MYSFSYLENESESEVAQSCPTLSDPVDCSPPGSSVHGIFQARALEWRPSPKIFVNLVDLNSNQHCGLSQVMSSDERRSHSRKDILLLLLGVLSGDRFQLTLQSGFALAIDAHLLQKAAYI